MKQAIAVCTANLEKRKANRQPQTVYRLYYSNDGNTREFITGSTIKQVIEEFRNSYTQYKYAVVTRAGEFKPLRFYNRDEGKKFFSMTRNAKKKK
jgi:hypothetical protein